MAKVYAVRRGCVFCCTCIHVCPVEAITMDKNGASINPEKCVGCGACADECPSEAIVEVSANGGVDP